MTVPLSFAVAVQADGFSAVSLAENTKNFRASSFVRDALVWGREIA